MKRIVLMAALLLCTGCACSMNQKPSPTPSSTPTASSAPEEKRAEDITGEETQFGTPIVSLIMKDGKITEISIDEITGDSTKKQMGEAYQLPETAVDTWVNQIQHLENYILNHDVNQIQTDAAGKAVDEDLLSGCTIQIDNYLKTVRKAMSEAKQPSK